MPVECLMWGYMAYELACELSHRIAAFGSVTGKFIHNENQICELNRKIPVLIEPMGYQAIMTGNGEDLALLDFLPKNHKLEVGNLVYTSGTGGIFFPGIPIGRIELIEEKFHVKFFSDLSQLYLIHVITTEPMKGAQ